MGIKDALKRKPAHTPVNPYTGKPNERDAGESAHQYIPHEDYWDEDAPVGDRATWAGDAGTAAWGQEPSDSVAASTDGAAGPDAPYFAAATPFDWGDDASNSAATAGLLGRLLQILDNRVLSIVMLFVLLMVVVGIEHILLFAIIMFVGYVLLDRFVQVRRCVVLGGAAWLLVIFAGFMLAEYAPGPLIFGIDSFFTFCGFLFALAVCASFFAGRSMYRFGFERGQADADAVIAQHMVDRLIDHPDDWGQLDGDFLEVEGAINRVREQQRLARQALRDEAGRKDDLVTYLAHDLKTPLASVVGYLSLLEEAPDLPLEQRARFTGIALEKAHRLDALIEEFFDITRFDFHDIVVTRGYVDLNLMLAQVVDEFYPTLAEQHKEAVIDVPLGLTVLVDGDKMARVFNNVMKNAIAYSYDGSTIRVTARRLDRLPAGMAPASEAAASATPAGSSAGAVEIRFENQGDPIPAPKLKVIFEKFYRLDAARTTNRGGAGLGLAIAKEIVTAHGGTIACTSTPEATVFTIVLPG